MNYCPECGNKVVLESTTPDVATTHATYKCYGCQQQWEETVVTDGVVLHISPVEGGG